MTLLPDIHPDRHRFKAPLKASMYTLKRSPLVTENLDERADSIKVSTVISFSHLKSQK